MYARANCRSEFARHEKFAKELWARRLWGLSECQKKKRRTAAPRKPVRPCSGTRDTSRREKTDFPPQLPQSSNEGWPGFYRLRRATNASPFFCFSPRLLESRESRVQTRS